MPPYSERDLKPNEVVKFLRLGNTVVTGPRGSQHKELAVAEGIYDDIVELRRDNPSDIDGGLLNINPDYIQVLGDSSSLGMTATPAGRAKTIDIIRSQSQSHDVTE